MTNIINKLKKEYKIKKIPDSETPVQHWKIEDKFDIFYGPQCDIFVMQKGKKILCIGSFDNAGLKDIKEIVEEGEKEVNNDD